MNDETTERYMLDARIKYSAKKISVAIEVESKMNHNRIVFTHSEKDIGEAYDVFKYWHDHKGNFSITSCARYHGISYYNVKKIFDKYLKGLSD